MSGMLSYFDRLEHNVKYVFLFTISYWSANSIISQQVLAGYIYVLTGSNEPVGIVKGIQGITQLICALPAGCAADHMRRDRILAFSGVIGVLASILTGFAFEIGHLKLIYIAFGLWGVFAAFQSPAMEALFADSVPAGQRSLPFTLKHMTLNAALVIGPAIAILLFHHYGDVWEIPVLRAVILFGTFVSTVSMFSLFQFDDDQAYENKQYVLAVERELCSIERNFDVEMSDCLAVEVEIDPTMDAEDPVDENEDQVYATPVGSGTNATSERSLLLTSPTARSALYTATPVDEDNTKPPLPAVCGLEPHHVPYMLFVSDFIISNGAGMTVNFFPLFFYKEFGLSPIHVQIMFVLQPICVAFCSCGAQLASKMLGRMPVIVSTRLVGTICLLAMSVVTNLHAQCILFLVRAATMRCTEPLRRSLLMDFVPKNQRARWNSLEGLSMFSWAGSAVIGGFLVEAHGYRYCFFITSLVYFVGVLMELVLIPVTRHAIETDGTPRQKS